jgi:hypothetical protein
MGNTLGHWNEKEFFGKDPKRTGNQSKNKEMELHQNKKILYKKGKPTTESRDNLQDGRKYFCKLYICTG